MAGPELGGLAGILQSPYAKMALDWLMDTLVSNKSDLLKFSNMDPSRSFAANFQQNYNHQLQKVMFGYNMRAQGDRMAQRFTQGIFSAFGNDQASSFYQSNKVGAGIIGWGVDMLLGDKWNEGMSTIYGSAFGRRAYEMRNGGDFTAMQSDYTQLTDNLLKMHFEQGAFRNLSFSDVGGLAAHLIGSGRYDTFQYLNGRRATSINGEFIGPDGKPATGDALAALQKNDPHGTGAWERQGVNDKGEEVWGLVKRSDVIANDVKQYAKAIGKLQDVIGGDMPQVLDTLDKLFGGSATAMSPQRLDALTSNLRHSMTATGMSLQQVAALAGTGFNYIAPFGGTEAQGVSMANVASYYIGAGITREGVKADVFGSMIQQRQANRMIDGSARYLAAAYRAYADDRKLNINDRASYDKFLQELGDTQLTQGNLNNWMRKHTKHSEAYFSAITHSEATTRLIEQFDMSADLLGDDVRAVNKMRKAEFTKMLRENGVKGSLKNVIGDYENMTDDEVRDSVRANLAHSGLSADKIEVIAEKAAEIQGGTATTILGGTRGEATQLTRNYAMAERARKQKLYQDQLKDLYGKFGEALDEKGTAGGVEGVMQLLIAGNDDKTAIGFTDVVLATVGLTSAQAHGLSAADIKDSAKLAAVFNQNEDKIKAQYKAVFGKDYEGKKGEKTEERVANMTKALMGKAMESRYTASAIWGSQMKQGAKLSGNQTYESVQAQAIAASMVLQNPNADPKAKEEAVKALGAWSSVTEGEDAALVNTAIEEGKVEDLWTEEGRKGLKKKMAQNQKIDEYVNMSYENTEANAEKRATLQKAVKTLQSSKAFSGLSGAQRSKLSDMLQFDENGKLKDFTADQVKALESMGFDAAKQKELMGQLRSVEAAQNPNLSAESRMEAMHSAITLTDSNDPMTVLGNKFTDLFQQILNAITEISGKM